MLVFPSDSPQSSFIWRICAQGLIKKIKKIKKIKEMKSLIVDGLIKDKVSAGPSPSLPRLSSIIGCDSPDKKDKKIKKIKKSTGADKEDKGMTDPL